LAALTTNRIFGAFGRSYVGISLCASVVVCQCVRVCEWECVCANCTPIVASLHIQKGSARSAFLWNFTRF